MGSRTKQVFAAFSASVLLVVVALAGWGIVSFSVPGPFASSVQVSPEAAVNFNQFVVVLMENHDLADIYGPAPYMTGLADQYAFSQGWSSITNPSQPNYIALLGGSTFGVSGDGNHPNLNHPTMVDIIETSGHTWKAFAEDASGSGCGINPPRGEDHFPFLSYTTITGNPARCANLLPGSSNEVIAALNAGTNFIWLTPNDCNNMHSCSVGTGDSWLQSWVPSLLSAMAGKQAALFIMYDEGYRNPPLIYAGFSGPSAKPAYKSTAAYTHYSLLKLLEDVWGGGNLGQGDVGAASPTEFFQAAGPDFSISANPTSVSFFSGQSATSTISLTSAGGFVDIVTLSAASAPAGVTGSCSPSSISGSQTSTCTLSGSTAGTYTVTVTGSSGSLVHTTSLSATVAAPGPIARFTYSPPLPSVSVTVTFDASASSDSDPSATLQARWDWEGDGTWDTSFDPSLTSQHAFDARGTYPVTLEIQDSHGLSDTVTQMIAVLDLGSGGAGAPPGYGLTDASKLQPHTPIAIASNAGFIAANGVRSGSGTPADPFVISDWFIDGSLYAGSQAMIWIENTDAYVVIENVKIVNLADANHWEGIQLGHWPATVSTQHVTIRHNAVENARHAYGIAVREGSSDVRVEANYVRLDANFEWVYGIATDRGVHNVTIYGNYVDAYTSGSFHTTGIHMSDTHIDDARRATGLIATRNTVVNATGGAIVSASSSGTIIGWNLAYMDYPGPKSVSPDYPRGIDTAWNSDGAIVIGNVIYSFHQGIQVGSDHGLILSNTIHDVDYAIYVEDTGSSPGITSDHATIYDTTSWNVANDSVRIPPNFIGTVVDLGSGIRSTDLTPVHFVSSIAPSRVTFSWSGLVLNLSAIVGGVLMFDSATAGESQTLQASWTGSLTQIDLHTFSPSKVAFQLQSGADVAFSGSAFTPSTTYNLIRSNADGTTAILSAQATPTGTLTFTIPAAQASSYEVTTEGGGPGFSLPGVLQAMPLLFPAIALSLLLVSYFLFRRKRRGKKESHTTKRRKFDPSESDDSSEF